MLIRQTQSTNVSSNIQKRDNLDKKKTNNNSMTNISTRCSRRLMYNWFLSVASSYKNNHREDYFRRKKIICLIVSSNIIWEEPESIFLHIFLYKKLWTIRQTVFLINFLMIRLPYTKGDQCFTSSPKPDEWN
jgi:hypothetical protein